MKSKSIENLDGSTTFFTYWDNGQIKSESDFLNHQLHGIGKNYYENGNLRSEDNCLNDQLHGLCKEYFPNGNLESEVNYLNDEFHGICRDYYENGNIESEHYYLNGKCIHEMIWHKDGTLSAESKHDKNGGTHGKCIELFENGNVKRIAIYRHRVLIEEKNFDELTGKERKGRTVCHLRERFDMFLIHLDF